MEPGILALLRLTQVCRVASDAGTDSQAVVVGRNHALASSCMQISRSESSPMEEELQSNPFFELLAELLPTSPRWGYLSQLPFL